VSRGITLFFLGPLALDGVGGLPHPPAASTPGKDPVPIVQEAGWAPGPVWTGGKSHPHRDSISDCPARSSVAIPTELPGPQEKNNAFIKPTEQSSGRRVFRRLKEWEVGG